MQRTPYTRRRHHVFYKDNHHNSPYAITQKTALWTPIPQPNTMTPNSSRLRKQRPLVFVSNLDPRLLIFVQKTTKGKKGKKLSQLFVIARFVRLINFHPVQGCRDLSAC